MNIGSYPKPDAPLICFEIVPSIFPLNIMFWLLIVVKLIEVLKYAFCLPFLSTLLIIFLKQAWLLLKLFKNLFERIPGFQFKLSIQIPESSAKQGIPVLLNP